MIIFQQIVRRESFVFPQKCLWIYKNAFVVSEKRVKSMGKRLFLDKMMPGKFGSTITWWECFVRFIKCRDMDLFTWGNHRCLLEYRRWKWIRRLHKLSQSWKLAHLPRNYGCIRPLNAFPWVIVPLKCSKAWAWY